MILEVHSVKTLKSVSKIITNGQDKVFMNISSCLSNTSSESSGLGTVSPLSNS